MKRIINYIVITVTTLFFNLSAADESGKPVLTVAGIVHICPQNKIALIERSKSPKGLALFGGHVESRESPEKAFHRELQEELNITQVENLELIGVHGDYGRDPRQHSVEITYACTTTQMPRAGSDAKSVNLYDLHEIENRQFAFDHGKILQNYIQKLNGCNPCKSECDIQ
jgi:ADP-ribose pyrophosphatase YjhB (NUDIX family)